ncbi:MAG: hypothetical protein CVU39_09155 [Chloroflexi bacterium HGW-Chloroflexi-10]|nr:MAG: hypothetical protein CVU39_09155 [Chloroflexi bacterium HGW-Chloroflexi-10]
MQKFNWINKKGLANWAALPGAAIFLYQLFQFVQSMRSSLDEGIYLVKGFWMATGVYAPYQPYGFWMNKMPLSFLIPGWIQALFGPGLLTARIYAFILALLIMLGVWLIARRISGGWVAALLVWIMALNPVGIKMYSQATSQPLVACILVWTLFFLIGANRKTWQIFLGSVLAGILVLTRENMVFVLPFLVLLIFWQNGRKAGWYAVLAMGLVLLVGHAVFYPGIITNWVKWIPRSITPFLDAYRIENMKSTVYTQPNQAFTILSVVAQTIGWHTLAILGPAILWLTIPLKRFNVRNYPDQLKTALILSVMFIVLFAAHAWASLGNNYCVYCLSEYVAFFSPLGLLIIAALLPQVDLKHNGWLTRFSLLILPLVSAFLGFGAYTGFRGIPNFNRMNDLFFFMKIPWVREGRLVFGEVELWSLVANKFGFSFAELRVDIFPILISVLLGFLIGITILLIGRLVWRLWLSRRYQLRYPLFQWVLLLVILLLLAPTWVLGGGQYTYDCTRDTLQSTIDFGHSLAAQVGTAKTIYWEQNKISQVVLLYLDSPSIFPPQMNGVYSFRLGDNTDALLRMGYWNEELLQRWLKEADIIILKSDSTILSTPQDFNLLAELQPAYGCFDQSTTIKVYDNPH